MYFISKIFVGDIVMKVLMANIIRVANELDQVGYHKEANALDGILEKVAASDFNNQQLLHYKQKLQEFKGQKPTPVTKAGIAAANAMIAYFQAKIKGQDASGLYQKAEQLTNQYKSLLSSQETQVAPGVTERPMTAREVAEMQSMIAPPAQVINM